MLRGVATVENLEEERNLPKHSRRHGCRGMLLHRSFIQPRSKLSRHCFVQIVIAILIVDRSINPLEEEDEDEDEEEWPRVSESRL
jgi:hypothetical protein